MEASQPNKNTWTEESWSARRARHKIDEKRLMAQYCATHDFLVQDGLNPETDARETVASILVNQGTMPNIVVEEALDWVRRNQDRGPFEITWYTPGHLIPTTLRTFRESNPHLSLATQLFLFPGRVDLQTESVSGPDAAAFAEGLKRRFTYAFLSAYSFDIHNGAVFFHFPEELRLQRACAMRYAAHKFLFLDSSKFVSQGEIGYDIGDLLSLTETATIYTISSVRDEWIRMRFEELCNNILDPSNNTKVSTDDDCIDTYESKILRLRVVGTGETPTVTFERRGFLKYR